MSLYTLVAQFPVRSGEYDSFVVRATDVNDARTKAQAVNRLKSGKTCMSEVFWSCDLLDTEGSDDVLIADYRE